MRTAPNSREYVSALLSAADSIAAIDGQLFERTTREAVLVSEGIQDWGIHAISLAKHAWALYQTGQLGQGLLRAEQAAHIARQLVDGKCLNSALYTLAMIRDRIGDHASALQIWLGLINTAIAVGDHQAEARCRVMCGLSLSTYGNHPGALEQLKDGYEIFERHRDPGMALAANNVAVVALDQKDYELAIKWIERAVVSCPADSSLWRSYIAHTEGQLALVTSRYADARAAFARALEVLPGERDDVSHTANLYLDIGRLHIVEGAATKALASLDHALILAEDSGDAALVAKVHDALHDAYEKIGDFDSALRHCRKRGAALTRSAAAKSAEQIAVLKAAEALVHERAKWAAVRYSA